MLTKGDAKKHLYIKKLHAVDSVVLRFHALEGNKIYDYINTYTFNMENLLLNTFNIL